MGPYRDAPAGNAPVCREAWRGREAQPAFSPDNDLETKSRGGSSELWLITSTKRSALPAVLAPRYAPSRAFRTWVSTTRSIPTSASTAALALLTARWSASRRLNNDTRNLKRAFDGTASRGWKSGRPSGVFFRARIAPAGSASRPAPGSASRPAPGSGTCAAGGRAEFRAGAAGGPASPIRLCGRPCRGLFCTHASLERRRWMQRSPRRPCGSCRPPCSPPALRAAHRPPFPAHCGERRR